LKCCGVPQLFRPEAGFGYESGSHAFGRPGKLPQPLPYLSRQKALWNYAPMLSPM
jgi:hypothetical protein